MPHHSTFVLQQPFTVLSPLFYGPSTFKTSSATVSTGVCLSGTYADFPAKILIDPTKPQDPIHSILLHSQYALQCHDYTYVELPMLLVAAPLLFLLRMAGFVPNYHFKSCIPLGSWGPIGLRPVGLNFFMAVSVDHCKPLYVGHLPAGHSWVPRPPTTSYGASLKFI
jgi:hypothetical protein